MRETDDINAVTTQARRRVGFLLIVGLGLGLAGADEGVAAIEMAPSALWIPQGTLFMQHTGSSIVPGESVSSPAGALVARMAIPRLRTEWFVVSASTPDALQRGPGHVAGTAFPGEVGNCVIAGRCDTHFHVLKSVDEGDHVVLEVSAGQLLYRVTETAVVSSRDAAIFRQSDKSMLTLLTCYPFDHAATSPQRFVVRAELTHRGVVASLRHPMAADGI
jgi:LPXTG-site transpeptidase (sortase) family protein